MVGDELWELPWGRIGRWLLLTAPTALGIVGLVLSLRGKGKLFRRVALRMEGETIGERNRALLSRFPRVVRTLTAVRAWVRARLVIVVGVLLLAAGFTMAALVPRHVLSAFGQAALIFGLSLFSWLMALPAVAEVIAIVCLLWRVRSLSGPGGFRDWLKAVGGAAYASLRRGRLA
jgi:hypothetical protein